MKNYKGKYTPKNKKKYKGDASKVVYRSMWERQTFRWIEKNDDIIEWNSEDVIIPYLCETDNKMHRYYIDLYFMTRNGRKYLIEIKPEKQTRPPNKRIKNKAKVIKEQLIYIKNMSKWKAAKKFAEDNDCEFQIWTEKTLKGFGIKLLTA